MAGKVYADEQRIAALACLAANAGNYDKTMRETGVSQKTLRNWASTPLMDSPELPAIKHQLQEDFLSKAKEGRSILLRRLLELAPDEKDMFKVSGAFKIVNDAARLEGGEVTARTEARHTDENPERARLARDAADALERQWEQPSALN